MTDSTERQSYAVWPEATEWTHLTLVSLPTWDPAPLPDAFMPAPWATCRSPRGQPCCSCGRYRLEWT